MKTKYLHSNALMISFIIKITYTFLHLWAGYFTAKKEFLPASFTLHFWLEVPKASSLLIFGWFILGYFAVGEESLPTSFASYS
jgi:hypothetical protein